MLRSLSSRGEVCMWLFKGKNCVLALLLAVAAFSSGGCGGGSDDPGAMAKWAGSWKSESSYLDASDLDGAYSAVASSLVGVTSADVKAGFAGMFYSSIKSIEISGGSAVLTLTDGSVESHDYSFVGTAPIPGFGDSVWNKFQSSKDGKFKYLVVTEAHSDGDDGMKHWHFRYGSSGFDGIISSDNALWWPTFVAGDTTVEKVASDIEGEAAAMGQFLSSSPELKTWNGTWKSFSVYLDDPAMDEAYNAIAAKAKGCTAQDVKSVLSKMYDSKGVSSLSVADNVITLTSGGSSVSYNYDKRLFAPIPGFDGFFWYKFETGDGGSWPYIVMTQVHSDGPDAMKHYHVRFGNAGFSPLIDTQEFWYPTFVESSTAVSEVVEDFLAEADSLAEMVSALK